MSRKTPRERMADTSWRITTLSIELKGGWGLPGVTDPQQRADIERQIEQERAALAAARRGLEVENMRDKAKAIREQMRKQLAEVARRLDEVRAEDDEQFPVEFQVKRSAQRGELRREWKRIESAAQADMNAWAQEAQRSAQALYHTEPVVDAAAESRRVSEQMEIAALATPYIGQPTMVRNKLLPEARRYIALGVLDKARIHIEAARRAGVEDGRLDHALAAALDETVPHRKQAREHMRSVADEQDLFANDMYSTRLAHRFGTPSEQVQASTMTKMIEYRRREGLVPVAGTGGGSASGDGGGAAE